MLPISLGGKVLMYGLLALALLSMIGTGFYKVEQIGARKVQQKWDQSERDQRERELNQAGKAVTGLEVDRAKANVIYQEIEKRVVEYIDRPIYSTVCIDSDGLRDINSALLGKDSTGLSPDHTVPGTGPVAVPNR